MENFKKEVEEELEYLVSETDRAFALDNIERGEAFATLAEEIDRALSGWIVTSEELAELERKYPSGWPISQYSAMLRKGIDSHKKFITALIEPEEYPYDLAQSLEDSEVARAEAMAESQEFQARAH